MRIMIIHWYQYTTYDVIIYTLTIKKNVALLSW